MARKTVEKMPKRTRANRGVLEVLLMGDGPVGKSFLADRLQAAAPFLGFRVMRRTDVVARRLYQDYANGIVLELERVDPDARGEEKLQLDPVLRFFSATFDLRTVCEVPAAEAFSAYQRWCAQNGERPLPQIRFARRMRESVPLSRRAGVNAYQGIAFRSQQKGAGR